MHWKIIRVTKPEEFPQESVRELWLRDPVKSPFTSPHYLQEMASMALSQGDTVVLSVLMDSDGSFGALWPMRLNKQSTLRFLPFLYADQRSCIRKPGVSMSLLAEGIIRILAETSPKRLDLEYVSEWNRTREALVTGLAQTLYSHVSYPESICLLATRKGWEEGKKNLFLVRKRTKELIRSLRRKGNLELRVVSSPDPHELEDWLHEFFTLHIRRWKETSTESKFRSEQERIRFDRVLKAWQRDEILYLFTLHIDGLPKAFNVLLSAGERLIFTHHARDVHSKYSPGTILHVLAGEWALEHGFSIYDFGLGDEPYKRRFADAQEHSWQICGSRHLMDPVLLRHRLEKVIRVHPKALQTAKALKEFLRPLLTKS